MILIFPSKKKIKIKIIFASSSVVTRSTKINWSWTTLHGGMLNLDHPGWKCGNGKLNSLIPPMVYIQHFPRMFQIQICDSFHPDSLPQFPPPPRWSRLSSKLLKTSASICATDNPAQSGKQEEKFSRWPAALRVLAHTHFVFLQN